MWSKVIGSVAAFCFVEKWLYIEIIILFSKFPSAFSLVVVDFVLWPSRPVLYALSIGHRQVDDFIYRYGRITCKSSWPALAQLQQIQLFRDQLQNMRATDLVRQSLGHTFELAGRNFTFSRSGKPFVDIPILRTNNATGVIEVRISCITGTVRENSVLLRSLLCAIRRQES